jgi:hypothetical protein
MIPADFNSFKMLGNGWLGKRQFIHYVAADTVIYLEQELNNGDPAGCARAFNNTAMLLCLSVNCSVFETPICFIFILQYYDKDLNCGTMENNFINNFDSHGH